MINLIKNQSGYQLQGRLVYDSVHKLIAKGAKAIASTSNRVEIDCEQLSRIDSAGIALFINWQRYCEQNNQTFHLTHLPSQAISLIKANKLDDFFNYQC
jgi:phospholipid transport system transporter-binding protein